MSFKIDNLEEKIQIQSIEYGKNGHPKKIIAKRLGGKPQEVKIVSSVEVPNFKGIKINPNGQTEIITE